MWICRHQHRTWQVFVLFFWPCKCSYLCIQKEHVLICEFEKKQYSIYVHIQKAHVLICEFEKKQYSIYVHIQKEHVLIGALKKKHNTILERSRYQYPSLDGEDLPHMLYPCSDGHYIQNCGTASARFLDEYISKANPKQRGGARAHILFCGKFTQMILGCLLASKLCCNITYQPNTEKI